MTLPHSAQIKYYFLIKTKEKSKSQNQIPKKKFSLGLFHQILVNISTRSLVAGYTENVWQDIELRLDTDHLCTSYQISTINKNSRSKKPLKTNTPSNWVFIDIIPAISTKSLTKDTIFDNCLLIVHAYSEIIKLYGMESITTEEVMEKIDMFQEIFLKVD